MNAVFESGTTNNVKQQLYTVPTGSSLKIKSMSACRGYEECVLLFSVGEGEEHVYVKGMEILLPENSVIHTRLTMDRTANVFLSGELIANA